MADTKTPIIHARGLSKDFRMGDATVHVLKECDFTLNRGEFVAIEGRSGSGKSTLLHLLGCLDKPSAGTITYSPAGDRESELVGLGDSSRSRLRNTAFGFVFQFYHLLPELNVLQNTLLGAYVQNSPLAWLSGKSPAKKRATELLEQMGLSHRLTHRPNQLSGGERQRVAIARALMNKPTILYADEPTGNLDQETGQQIMSVLEKLHQQQGQTIVMVTHDRTLARQADRALLLREGKLVEAA
jgi:lipoprotein-releasing system ATP-binding protein